MPEIPKSAKNISTKQNVKKKASKNPLKNLQNCIKHHLKCLQKSSKNHPQNPPKSSKNLSKKNPNPKNLVKNLDEVVEDELPS